MNRPDNAATSAGARWSSSLKKKVVASRARPKAPCTKYTAMIAIISQVKVIPCPVPIACRKCGEFGHGQPRPACTFQPTVSLWHVLREDPAFGLKTVEFAYPGLANFPTCRSTCFSVSQRTRQPYLHETRMLRLSSTFMAGTGCRMEKSFEHRWDNFSRPENGRVHPSLTPSAANTTAHARAHATSVTRTLKRPRRVRSVLPQPHPWRSL